MLIPVLLMFNGCVEPHQNGGADTTHHSDVKPRFTIYARHKRYMMQIMSEMKRALKTDTESYQTHKVYANDAGKLLPVVQELFAAVKAARAGPSKTPIPVPPTPPTRRILTSPNL
jgi:hypothetical protein